MGPYPPKEELAQHEPQPIRDRPLGLGFHTVRGDIDPDDIRVHPRVAGVVDVWMDSDPGM